MNNNIKIMLIKINHFYYLTVNIFNLKFIIN